MKCPKCDYLGFETGDRCRNCGYDFSLLSSLEAPAADPDPLIRPDDDPSPVRTTPWLAQLDRMFGEAEPAPVPIAAEPPPVPQPMPAAEPVVPAEPEFRITPALTLDDAPIMPPPAFRGEPALPLFTPASEDDDAPLVKLPATPRPPLAVRRTPDRPRLRAVAKLPEVEPTLEFNDAAESVDAALGADREAPPARRARQSMPVDGEASGAGARVIAALVDHAILFAIDALVIYFTLRLAALTIADWRAIPAVPMLTFLAMVKVAYFAAFTAVGGQTIGKMAAGIRVITDERGFVDPARAVRRTLAGAVSFVTLGLAFIPALFGSDKRALHDRVAHTRVVALPSMHS